MKTNTINNSKLYKIIMKSNLFVSTENLIEPQFKYKQKYV